MRNSMRGVSPVVGLVLLIGIVAIGSMSLFIIGGQMMTGFEQQAEQERVEQSFIELRQTISTEKVARNTQGVTLNAGERGAIDQFGLWILIPWKAAALALFYGFYRAVPSPYSLGIPIGLALLGAFTSTWNTLISTVGIPVV